MAQTAGGMTLLFAKVLSRLARLQFDRQELMRNLYKMGVKSIPIVIVTSLFTGGIMVIQAAPIVKRYAAQGLLGWAAGFGTLREIGPLLTALMLSGRVGANNTAELGTMVVTEQIDALRALAIDPIGFLITPRVIAFVTTLFLATLYADALALFGAAYAGYGLLDVEPRVFYNGLTSGLLTLSDVGVGLVKSVVFGTCPMATKSASMGSSLVLPVTMSFSARAVTRSSFGSSTRSTTVFHTTSIFGCPSARAAMIFEARKLSRRCTSVTFEQMFAR